MTDQPLHEKSDETLSYPEGLQLLFEIFTLLIQIRDSAFHALDFPLPYNTLAVLVTNIRGYRIEDALKVIRTFHSAHLFQLEHILQAAGLQLAEGETVQTVSDRLGRTSKETYLLKSSTAEPPKFGED